MFFEVVLPVYVNQVETNPVEHGQGNMITPALQRWPFQLLQHGCYAGLSAVVAGDISGTVPLDLFHFLDVTLSVGTPSYCSILKDRTNVGLVSCLLDLAAAVMEVSPKKCSGWVSLLRSDLHECWSSACYPHGGLSTELDLHTFMCCHHPCRSSPKQGYLYCEITGLPTSRNCLEGEIEREAQKPTNGVQAYLYGPWWGPGGKSLIGGQGSAPLCTKLCIGWGKLHNFRPLI